MIVDADVKAVLESLQRGECQGLDPEYMETCGYGTFCSKACELRDANEKLTEALRLTLKIARRAATDFTAPQASAATAVLSQLDRLEQMYLKVKS